MVAKGLALIGFLPQQNAVHFLASDCVPANPHPQALAAEWQTAATRLGPPPPNFGQPNVRDVHPSHAGRVHQLLTSRAWQQTFAANPAWKIKLVEIAPLLAFQPTIVLNKSTGHCGGFTHPPSLDKLFDACLPLHPPQEQVHIQHQGGAMLIRSKSLNLRSLVVGHLGNGDFGAKIGLGLPFAHVVRFNGRSYLHNGYHRAYGAAAAGATEIPCIYRDVRTAEEVGIGPGSFDLQLLESANPPTLKHFIAGEAYDVDLIEKTRIIQITCQEWAASEY